MEQEYIPQIDAGKIATIFNEYNDSIKILDYFADKEGKIFIPTEDIAAASKFLEYKDAHYGVMNEMIGLYNLAQNIKPQLEKSLELAGSSVTSANQPSSSRERGLLDIIEATEILIHETAKEKLSDLKEKLEEIEPSKPKTKLRIKIKQLNSAIKEVYTNRNLLQVHAACMNIMQTTNWVFNEITPSIGLEKYWGRSHRDHHKQRNEYVNLLAQLNQYSAQQKGVKIQYKHHHDFKILEIKSISFPKPKPPKPQMKRRWYLLGKKTEVKQK